MSHGFGFGPRFPENKPSEIPGPGQYNVNVSSLTTHGVAPLAHPPPPPSSRHKRTRTSLCPGKDSANPNECLSADCHLRWQAVNQKNELLDLEIFTLKQQKEHLNREIRELRQRADHLTAQQGKSAESIKALKDEAAANQAKLAQLTAQLATVETQLKDAAMKAATSAIEKAAEFAALEARVATTEEAKQRAEQDKLIIQKTLNELNEAKMAAENEFSARVESLKLDFQREKGELAGRIASLEDRQQGEKQEKQEILEKQQALQETIDRTAQETEELRSQLEATEVALQAAQVEKAAATERLEELKETLGQMDGAVEAASNSIVTLEQQIHEKDEFIAQAEIAVERLQAEVAAQQESAELSIKQAQAAFDATLEETQRDHAAALAAKDSEFSIERDSLINQFSSRSSHLTEEVEKFQKKLASAEEIFQSKLAATEAQWRNSEEEVKRLWVQWQALQTEIQEKAIQTAAEKESLEARCQSEAQRRQMAESENSSLKETIERSEKRFKGELSHLEAIKEAENRAAQRAAEAEQEKIAIRQALEERQATVERLSEERLQAESALEVMKARESSWASDEQRMNGELAKALADRQAVEESLRELEAEAAEKEAAIADLNKALMNSEASYKARLEEFEARMSQEKQAASSAAHQRVSHLESEIEQLRNAQGPNNATIAFSDRSLLESALREAEATIGAHERQLSALKREFEAAKVSQAAHQSELSAYRIKTKATKEKLQKELAEARERIAHLEHSQASHVCENRDITELRLQLHGVQAALDSSESQVSQLTADLQAEIERAAATEGHNNPKQRIHLHQQIKMENNSLKAENAKLRLEITQLLAGSHPVQIKKILKQREREDAQVSIVAAARARKDGAGKSQDSEMAEQENRHDENREKNITGKQVPNAHNGPRKAALNAKMIH